MPDTNRVQRWRQQQREAGKIAVTIWLPQEMAFLLTDLSIKRRRSVSELTEQALAVAYQQRSDVAATPPDTIVTDTSQLRLVLQQELQALLDESLQHQGVQAREGVTDTAADTGTVMSQLRTVVEEAVWEAMDKWQQYQHLPVVPIVTDTATDTVTDTATDTTTKATMAPVPADITDTVPDTQHAPETDLEAMPFTPTPRGTDTVAHTEDMPPFDPIKYRLGKLCKQGHDYHGTGQSLRVTNKAGYCIKCNTQAHRDKRDTKRRPAQATA
jgi:hypothetical protein